MKKLYILFSLLVTTLFITNVIAQNALSFDGVNDHVICGNSSSVQITGNAITLEAWIYPTAFKTNIWEGNIINKESPGAGYMLRCGAGGKLNFNLGSGPWNELSSTTNVLTLNTWQHVAGTYDGSFMRIYVNGNIVDSIAKTITISNATSNLCIGEGLFYINREFTGKIDEVRVWNVRRTKTELLNQMNSELCAVPSSVKAYYTFNQGIAGGTNTTTNTLTDLSGNSNTGTLTNFSLSGTTSNWATGQTLTPGIVTSSIPVSTCGSYTMPNGTVVSTNGTYFDTLASSSGCDSLIAYNITFSSAHIVNSYSNAACVSYTMPNGSLISVSGIYYDTLSVSGGCDTLDKYTIAISASVDDSVYRVGGRITSFDTWASHQWVRCDSSFAPITGETNRFIIATQAGNYAVIVSRGSCIDTSDCVNIVLTSIEENELDLISIFPNPTENILNINNLPNEAIVTIYNVEGRIINSFYQLSKIDVSSFSSGIYYLEVNSNENRRTIKFVKH